MQIGDFYLSLFDLIILMPFGWAAYKGLKNGFIVEALSLASVFLGVLIYIRLTTIPSRIITGDIAHQIEYLPLIFFAAALAIIIFASNFVEDYARNHIKTVDTTPFHKGLGVSLSLFKYLFLVSCFMVFLDKVNEKISIYNYNSIQKSIFYNFFTKAAPTMFPYLEFENIKNSGYISYVKSSDLNFHNEFIPINSGIEALSRESNKVPQWVSYKYHEYRDQANLVVVEAMVENKDMGKTRTLKFQFLLKRDTKEVSLLSFRVNEHLVPKAYAYLVLQKGRLILPPLQKQPALKK